MATCTYNPGINSSNPYAVLEVKQTNQNVSANTSRVAWALRLYRPSSISSSAPKSYSVTINGNRVSSGTTTIGGSGTKTIASGVIESVAHNSDGTKTISFSFSLDFEINWSGTWIGTGSASGSLALSTIARATTPTLNPSSVTIGNSITISLPRASSSFTHALSYRFGGATGSIGGNLGTSAKWTVPMSLISEIPNAVSGTGTIVCNTYNNGTLIGSKSVTFTATVPSSVVPTISSVSVTEYVSGLASKFGAYVQNNSRLSISISATGTYGSTISKYEVRVDGKTYSGNAITTDVLTTAGGVTITTTVTDSRGRKATNEKKISVLAYSTPTITTFVPERGTSTGVADEEGTYLRANVNFSISSINSKNDKSYKIEYKRPTDETWSTALSGSAYSFSGTIKSSSSIFNLDYEYQVRLTISDYFTSVSVTVDIGSGFTLINYHESGRGLSFGRVAQREGYIDSYLPIHGFSGITYDIQFMNDTGDADDLTISGKYYIAAAKYDNLPITRNGWLEIMKYNDSYIYQRYITYAGEKYERIKAAGTWRDWTPIPKIQHGSVLQSVTPNTAISFSVTFPIPFSDAPSVVITPSHNSDVTALQFKLKTVSATGFTAYVYSSGGGTHRFYWMAML